MYLINQMIKFRRHLTAQILHVGSVSSLSYSVPLIFVYATLFRQITSESRNYIGNWKKKQELLDAVAEYFVRAALA